MQLNLGCPEFCPEYTCVDIRPKDPRVIRDDAVHYMQQARNIDRIRAFQLIEHLPNVGDFFQAAHNCLKDHGVLTIRTDNAEWWPFYLPLPKGCLSLGAHASERYSYLFSNGSKRHDGNIEHYALFTKLHIKQYAQTYGFKVLEIKRAAFGARLLAVLRKSI